MSRTRFFFAAVALFATACTTEGLAFIQDRRVQIVSPGYRELVDLPVTVDWEVVDDDLADNLGSDILFGVYVDIDAQPPREPMEYFARNDPPCLESPTCPDTRYLRDLGIRTTFGTEMTFRSLPLAPGVDPERGDPDFHEVILVLLDEDGARVGESAWRITFEVERS